MKTINVFFLFFSGTALISSTAHEEVTEIPLDDSVEVILERRSCPDHTLTALSPRTIRARIISRENEDVTFPPDKVFFKLPRYSQLMPLPLLISYLRGKEVSPHQHEQVKNAVEFLGGNKALKSNPPIEYKKASTIKLKDGTAGLVLYVQEKKEHE